MSQCEVDTRAAHSHFVHRPLDKLGYTVDSPLQNGHHMIIIYVALDNNGIISWYLQCEHIYNKYVYITTPKHARSHNVLELCILYAVILLWPMINQKKDLESKPARSATGDNAKSSRCHNLEFLDPPGPTKGMLPDSGPRVPAMM